MDGRLPFCTLLMLRKVRSLLTADQLRWLGRVTVRGRKFNSRSGRYQMVNTWLRSADIDTCIVPQTNTRLADRNFAVDGPRLWNSLPAELRPPDIELGEFRRLLKTFFGYVRHRRLVTFVSERLINIRLLAFVFVSLLGRIVLAGQAIPLNSYTLLRRMVCLSVTFVHSV